ncbi:response regulator [Brevibacillus sp. SAFN-007a]|uniref:response regulator n=1 Tax=Brevibacillus sp. SAFN-007a TaxID=3436862 RepID=UPI003F7DC333
MRHRFRIIIIDDDPITRMDLGEMLQEQGYNVVADGKNGEEAVSLTQRWDPHLVIMDVKMPVMDGWTAAGMIKRQSDASILLLTAYSPKDLETQAKTNGVCAYLAKPVMEEELLPAVESILLEKQTRLEK